MQPAAQGSYNTLGQQQFLAAAVHWHNCVVEAAAFSCSYPKVGAQGSCPIHPTLVPLLLINLDPVLFEVQWSFAIDSEACMQ